VTKSLRIDIYGILNVVKQLQFFELNILNITRFMTIKEDISEGINTALQVTRKWQITVHSELIFIIQRQVVENVFVKKELLQWN
jgi:hypothetical protein